MGLLDRLTILYHESQIDMSLDKNEAVYLEAKSVIEQLVRENGVSKAKIADPNWGKVGWKTKWGPN